MLIRAYYLYVFDVSQSIERAGRWGGHKALQQSYLQFYTPDALLTLAGWEEGAQKVFDRYWAERFHIAVTNEMVAIVFPFLPGLKAVVDDMGKQAGPSARSVVAVLEYLAVVAIQDMVQMASEGAYTNHPAHAYMLQHECFRYVPHT
jgi:hypothetical protein